MNVGRITFGGGWMEHMAALLRGRGQCEEDAAEHVAAHGCEECEAYPGIACDLERLRGELAELRAAYAESLERNGAFRSDVTYAATGTRQALTDDQLVATIARLRADADKARRMDELYALPCVRGVPCTDSWREWAERKAEGGAK